MILTRTFGRLKYWPLTGLGVLAIQLLFIISSTTISPTWAQCGNRCSANTTCVRRISQAQTCLALTCGIYPRFYKSPNILIGISDAENPFKDTHTIGIINKTRTLTIKSLNSTDMGRGIYYSIDEEAESLPSKCFFNIFLYGQLQMFTAGQAG